MTESFWLGGVSASPVTDASPQAGLAAVLKDLVKVTHFPAGAVEQVTWFSALGEADTLLPGLKAAGFEQACALCLPAIPELIHAQLQAASQAILAGERHAIVLGISSKDQVSAILLCSPEAAGKYNLLPKARIAARGTALPDRFDPQTLVKEAQGESDEEFTKIYWCGNSGFQPSFSTGYEKLDDYDNPINGFIHLAEVLRNDATALGLLLTGSNGATQATAVQSI